MSSPDYKDNLGNELNASDRIDARWIKKFKLLRKMVWYSIKEGNLRKLIIIKDKLAQMGTPLNKININ